MAVVRHLREPGRERGSLPAMPQISTTHEGGRMTSKSRSLPGGGMVAIGMKTSDANQDVSFRT